MGARAPVIALTLLLAIQELHVIVVKHEASGDAAGSYAVAAVAAKAIIWIAVGLGMYLVPEAARRAKTGEDARAILVRCLALIARRGRPHGPDLRGGRKAAARGRVRRGPHAGLRRPALAGRGDGAAGLHLPVGAVPARAAPLSLHLDPGRGRGGGGGRPGGDRRRPHAGGDGPARGAGGVRRRGAVPGLGAQAGGARAGRDAGCGRVAEPSA